MGFSRWARLAVSNKRLTKETLQSGPRERLEPVGACLGWKKTLPKKLTDVSAWAWGFVVGTPGGFEQKADGESLQTEPRERLERSLS